MNKCNIKQRYLFKNNEQKRLILRVIAQNFKLTKNIWWWSKTKLINNFLPITTLSRIKNICILTGRARSILRLCKITWLQIYKLASFAKLPGIFKYSW